MKYVEPNNFTKTYPELNDSSLMQSSPLGIQKLKSLIEQRGLKCEWIYVGAGHDVNSWTQQMVSAKEMGVRLI